MSLLSIPSLIKMHFRNFIKIRRFQFIQSRMYSLRTMSSGSISEKEIDFLWLRMESLYKEISINTQGTRGKKLWFEHLKDFSPQTLEIGLERLVLLKNTEHLFNSPPNYLQFRALCLGLVVTHISPRLIKNM